jgi:hypothetical protein
MHSRTGIIGTGDMGVTFVGSRSSKNQQASAALRQPRRLGLPQTVATRCHSASFDVAKYWCAVMQRTFLKERNICNEVVWWYAREEYDGHHTLSKTRRLSWHTVDHVTRLGEI